MDSQRLTLLQSNDAGLVSIEEMSDDEQDSFVDSLSEDDDEFVDDAPQKRATSKRKVSEDTTNDGKRARARIGKTGKLHSAVQSDSEMQPLVDIDGDDNVSFEDIIFVDTSIELTRVLFTDEAQSVIVDLLRCTNDDKMHILTKQLSDVFVGKGEQFFEQMQTTGGFSQHFIFVVDGNASNQGLKKQTAKIRQLKLQSQLKSALRALSQPNVVNDDMESVRQFGKLAKVAVRAIFANPLIRAILTLSFADGVRLAAIGSLALSSVGEVTIMDEVAASNPNDVVSQLSELSTLLTTDVAAAAGVDCDATADVDSDSVADAVAIAANGDDMTKQHIVTHLRQAASVHTVDTASCEPDSDGDADGVDAGERGAALCDVVKTDLKDFAPSSAVTADETAATAAEPTSWCRRPAWAIARSAQCNCQL